MADQRPQVARHLAALASVVGLFALVFSPAASAATAVPLRGWLATGTTFPQRALVLSSPPGKALSSANVHVTENGKPAAPLTVTPTANAGARDFGLVVAIDQHASMAGKPLVATLKATQGLAALRSAQQEFGVVSFGATPNVLIPLSTHPRAISHGLSLPSATGVTDVPAAISLALAQLAQSKVALGAIVIVSDGVGQLTSPNGATPPGVQAAAGVAHVPIITVGLEDHASTAASLAALSKAAPGQFVKTPVAGLPTVLKSIYAAVTRGYVVRWHSSQPSGHAVTVAATATGVSGSVDTAYSTPVPPAVSHPLTPGRHAHPVTQTALPQTKLSQSPGFVQPAVAPASTAPSSTQARNSFWASPLAVPIVAGICGLLIAMAVALALHRPSKRGVRSRVSSFIPTTDEGPEEAPALTTDRKSRSRGLLRMFERGTWWPPFVLNVQISRSPRTPIYLVRRAALIGLVLAVLLTLMMGSFVFGIIPLLGWPFVLKKLVARGARKQQETFNDTLPGYLQDLASAMRVGRSFPGALAIVADSAEEPMRGELERVVTDEALGRPIEAALEAVATRMASEDLSQVALIAALNKRSGSNVAEALDRVAEGSRERADLRREVRALTAQAKMSSYVLTALPGILLLGLIVVSPLYAHPLLHTTVGLVLLGVGGCLCFGGWKAMAKITDVEA